MQKVIEIYQYIEEKSIFIIFFFEMHKLYTHPSNAYGLLMER